MLLVVQGFFHSFESRGENGTWKYFSSRRRGDTNATNRADSYSPEVDARQICGNKAAEAGISAPI
jgi:hypothetical protein